MGISKPAVVATMLAVAPISAEAAQQGQQGQDKSTTIEVTAESLANVCQLPQGITVGSLEKNAGDLGTALSASMTVTKEEQVGAKAVAQKELDNGKKALTAEVAVLVKGVESLQKEMIQLVVTLPVETPENEFAQGGAKRQQLESWKKTLNLNSGALAAIARRVPVLQATVAVSDDVVQRRDTKAAFAAWEKATEISCEDPVENFVVTQGAFPLNQSVLTSDPAVMRRRATGEDISISSLIGPRSGVGTGGYSGSMEQSSEHKELFAFIAEVNEVKDGMVTDFLTDARKLSETISRMTLDE